MRNFLLFLILSMATSLVFSEDWRHAGLKSENGIEIKMDYKTRDSRPEGCLKCQLTTYADPLWINISGGSLKESDKVRLVLINIAHYSYTPQYPSTDVNYLDLTWDKDHFTGDYKSVSQLDGHLYSLPIYASGYGGIWIYDQELAIVVNGTWLVDPISKKNNFKFIYKNHL